jgi:transposase
MSDGYVRGIDRQQVLLLPERVEDYVGPNHLARVVDAFVNALRHGDEEGCLPPLAVMSSRGGRPGFHPRAIAKLLIWGYLNRVRSTRELEKAAQENLVVIWLLQKLTPDHATISRFRAAHAKRIKNWLREFNGFCARLELFGAEEVAVDGTILKAVNSKANNFTPQRLARRDEKVEVEIQSYLEALEASEQQGSAAQVAEIDRLQEKLSQLLTEQEANRDMLRQAQASPTGQLSLVDEDARLLKKKSAPGTAVVGYNAQSAVDAKHHLIAAVEVTQAGNDAGQLTPMLLAAREGMHLAPGQDGPEGSNPEASRPIRALADSGYDDHDDIAAAEEAGFEPHVRVRACSPAAGRGLFALEEFRYEEEADVYHCPGGERLHRHDDTTTRGSTYQCYYNTAACRQCPLRERCTTGAYRKIKRHPKAAAIGRMKARMEQNPEVYERRKALVEHPFGSMLFWSPGRHLLCRGLEKANAEFSLSALAYNIKRAAKVVGVAALLEALRRFFILRAAPVVSRKPVALPWSPDRQVFPGFGTG